MKILIVEDDRALCDTLFDALSTRGLEVSQAYSGDAAIEMIYEQHYELLLLDINLPGNSGFEVLREAKRHYDTIASLFMTALDTPEHLEQSFLSGGDDYIRKPFSIKELYLRLDAIYKRLYGLKTVRIALGGAFAYDATTQRLFRDETDLMLKPKLTRLLHLLATHANQILPREQIEAHVWEGESLPDAAILRIYIKELRDIVDPVQIETVRGVGYRLQTL